MTNVVFSRKISKLFLSFSLWLLTIVHNFLDNTKTQTGHIHSHEGKNKEFYRVAALQKGTYERINGFVTEYVEYIHNWV